ncbi:MAG: hypothetical protein JWM64_2945 [Frankiales bacterium]|nr:hypothetical protein [Frankiales bacterium]
MAWGLRWPWQHDDDAPAPAARAADDGARPAPGPAGWAFLPPLQRTVGAMPLTTAPAAFPAQLSLWADPSSMGRLTHLLDRDAPAGTVDGDGGGVPVVRGGGLELPLVQERTPLQRVVTAPRAAAPRSVPTDLTHAAPPHELPLLHVDALPERDAPAAAPEAPSQEPPYAPSPEADVADAFASWSDDTATWVPLPGPPAPVQRVRTPGSVPTSTARLGLGAPLPTGVLRTPQREAAPPSVQRAIDRAVPAGDRAPSSSQTPPAPPSLPRAADALVQRTPSPAAPRGSTAAGSAEPPADAAPSLPADGGAAAPAAVFPALSPADVVGPAGSSDSSPALPPAPAASRDASPAPAEAVGAAAPASAPAVDLSGAEAPDVSPAGGSPQLPVLSRLLDVAAADPPTPAPLDPPPGLPLPLTQASGRQADGPVVEVAAAVLPDGESVAASGDLAPGQEADPAPVRDVGHPDSDGTSPSATPSVADRPSPAAAAVQRTAAPDAVRDLLPTGRLEPTGPEVETLPTSPPAVDLPVTARRPGAAAAPPVLQRSTAAAVQLPSPADGPHVPLPPGEVQVLPVTASPLPGGAAPAAELLSARAGAPASAGAVAAPTPDPVAPLDLSVVQSSGASSAALPFEESVAQRSATSSSAAPVERSVQSRAASSAVTPVDLPVLHTGASSPVAVLLDPADVHPPVAAPVDLSVVQRSTAASVPVPQHTPGQPPAAAPLDRAAVEPSGPSSAAAPLELSVVQRSTTSSAAASSDLSARHDSPRPQAHRQASELSPPNPSGAAVPVAPGVTPVVQRSPDQPGPARPLLRPREGATSTPPLPTTATGPSAELPRPVAALAHGPVQRTVERASEDGAPGALVQQPDVPLLQSRADEGLDLPHPGPAAAGTSEPMGLAPDELVRTLPLLLPPISDADPTPPTSSGPAGLPVASLPGATRAVASLQRLSSGPVSRAAASPTGSSSPGTASPQSATRSGTSSWGLPVPGTRSPSLQLLRAVAPAPPPPGAPSPAALSAAPGRTGLPVALAPPRDVPRTGAALVLSRAVGHAPAQPPVASLQRALLGGTPDHPDAPGTDGLEPASPPSVALPLLGDPPAASRAVRLDDTLEQPSDAGTPWGSAVPDEGGTVSTTSPGALATRPTLGATSSSGPWTVQRQRGSASQPEVALPVVARALSWPSEPAGADVPRPPGRAPAALPLASAPHPADPAPPAVQAVRELPPAPVRAETQVVPAVSQHPAEGGHEAPALGPEEAEKLALLLMPTIVRRLKAELLLGRERRGLRTGAG